MVVEGVISCDSHLVEPSEALPEGARWDGEGGVLLTLGEGYDCPTLPVWAAVSNGRPLAPIQSLNTQPAAFDPVARRQWQVDNGVAAEVLYPTFASLAIETALTWGDSEEAAQRYNDWAKRFKPPHCWPLHLIAATTNDSVGAEMQWAHAHGRLGVLLPNQHMNGHHWKDFEPAFAEAERLGLPVHWHSFSRPNKASFGRYPLQVAWEAFRPAQDILIELLCEGVLARHPGLRVVFAEADCAWVLHCLYRLQRYAEHYGQLTQFQDVERLFSIVSQQVSFAVQNPGEALSVFKGTGLWGCDFPHADAVEPSLKSYVNRTVLNQHALELYPRIGEALGV